jgi:hypothetical protein
MRDPRRQPAMINMRLSAGLKRHSAWHVLPNCTARQPSLDYGKIYLRCILPGSHFWGALWLDGPHEPSGGVFVLSQLLTLLIRASLAEMSSKGIMVSFA